MYSHDDVAHTAELNNYLDIMAITFLYFDVALTFADEVELIWRRPKSLSSTIFFVNRYILSAANAVAIGLAIQAWFEGQYAISIHPVLNVFPAVLILRTYALYGRGRKVTAALGVMGVILIASEAWSILPMIGHTAGYFSGACYDHIRRQDVIIHSAVRWDVLFLFDLAIFALTIYKTYEIEKGDLRALSGRMPIGTLMLRDGAIYFAVMAAANLANILTFYIEHAKSSRGILCAFANCLSVALMSRLMLNIHEVGVASSAESDTLMSNTISRRLHNHTHSTSVAPMTVNCVTLGFDASAHI
ncbi:hypothetical protein PLICRDRAFT_173888 [Plicaturopsis crispa FD-325 SS-3]|nr:hypothetical protein PLICRDRAFT_173888 [Plicaturopsis crispa FD-325 SS-3]